MTIVQVGDPVLRQPTRELTVEELRGESIQHLIEAMRETMRAAPGVGLAAPQIGEGLRLAVIEDRAEYQEKLAPEERVARRREAVPFHVIVNPRLTVIDPTPIEFFEGCLSFAGFVALVPRATSVRVEALDQHGAPVTITAHGWYARILQHEIDHLDGTVCVDRMLPRSLATVENHGRYWSGKPLTDVPR